LLCCALVQQPLAMGSLYESPLLSYVVVRYVRRHSVWRAPSVMASILQRLRYGMRLTLLGASCAKWLLLRNSGTLPNAPIAAQATEALRNLHQQWLCGTESRSVNSALDNLTLYVKLLARHSLPSRTICERAQQLVSFGYVQLPLAQWCNFLHALLARCSHTLHDGLLFALPGTERFPHMHQLRENWFDKRLGASFIDNPANEALLTPWRHWLLAHVDTHPATSVLTLGAGGAEPRWHTPGIRQYL
jgi:hypothetical protein